MSKQSKNCAYTLLELAEIISANLHVNNADPHQVITGIATLKNATAHDLSFYTNQAYKNDVLHTKAGVVITSEKHNRYVNVAALVVKNPHHAYSRITKLFSTAKNSHDYIKSENTNIHPTAIIGNQSSISNIAYIGPYVVIGHNVSIGDDCIIHASSVIGDNCTIAHGTIVHPRVTLYSNIKVGHSCIIHSGAVIGADGFGFALADDKTWSKVEQLGGVVIGNNVEIGANTAIDCGALDDTLISEGVKLDNQIQIGHNVVIGKHSIFAGQVAIGGSTIIGDHCAVGGASTIAGHLEITSGVNLAGTSVTGKDIQEPGVYASGTGSVMPFTKWRRMTVNLENLDKHLASLKELNKAETSKED